MIGTSAWEYIFIRSCIFFLHSIAPLSIFYCGLVLFIRPSTYRMPMFLEFWLIGETLFYFTIFLPRKQWLQHAAAHPSPPSREKRREIFQLCHESVSDPERYLHMWFLGAATCEIRRDNVKEFFCWAFLNKAEYGEPDEEELDEYVNMLENILQRRIEPGRGTAVPLRLTLDKVEMLPRSLAWYSCVSVVDTITYVYMLCHSFHFHRMTIGRFFTVFPFRPLTLLSPWTTPAKTTTYWHRPHTSTTRLPVLFIHGIGIGLYPYASFLAELNHATEADGDVGIIAVEIMPISFRITHAALVKEEMCTEIMKILRKHKWEKFVLVTHSYGSVIATHLLRDQTVSNMISSTLLIDPVTFLLHHPDVAYNFTFRKPKRANEYQLHYFGSMDMGVAHTLFRTFFWSENILWKHDISGRQVTVVLSAKDLIVNTDAVGRYLTEDEEGVEEKDWKVQGWKGKGLDILWFKELDHAQVFDRKPNRDILVNVVRAYSVQAKN